MQRRRNTTLLQRAICTSAVLLAASVATAAATTGATSSPGLYLQTTGSSALSERGLTGAGVTIAVVDTGVADLPALDGTVVHQVNLSAAPDRGDQFGHGTFVAGLVHEAAPGAKIVSLKLSGADGSVDVSQVIAALHWIVAHRDEYSIDVVNLSFGNNSTQSTQTSPLNYAVQRVWDNGMVVVASAGNVGDAPGTVTKPGDDPLVVTVGSSDEQGTTTRGDDFVPAFVSRGPTREGVAKPDLVAPGARLVSLRAPGSTIDLAHPEARIGSDGFRGSGTSFSAPLVAGLAAQLLQADPNLTPDQVKFALMAGATPIDGDPAAQGAGTVRGGRSVALTNRYSANRGVTRSNGRGSLDGARGSARVELRDSVRLDSGAVTEMTVPVVGEAVAAATDATLPTSVLQLADAERADAALADFASDEVLAPSAWDASSWGASSWGASSWGASSWGASSWGASSWGASSWGASSWGSSQWWASSWG